MFVENLRFTKGWQNKNWIYPKIGSFVKTNISFLTESLDLKTLLLIWKHPKNIQPMDLFDHNNPKCIIPFCDEKYEVWQCCVVTTCECIY